MLMSLVLALSWHVSVVPCDVAPWRRAFERHVATYPKAQAADLYKLAHQGIMGSEHAVGDTASVRAYLAREVAQLTSGATTRTDPVTESVTESVSEPLPPDGRFVRVHLRPFLERRGSTDSLLRAFIATANGAKGDTARFACAERALKASPSLAVAAEAAALIASKRRDGFPAIHHSTPFERAYGPAYRVVEASRRKTTR